MRPADGSGDAAAPIRRGILAIAAVGVLGIWLELAVARHWRSPVQMVPWVAALLIGVAVALVFVRPDRSRVMSARALAALCIASGGFGVIQHVKSNFDSGELDAVYGPRWGAMSVTSRLWHAAIESVGPSPSFAPGALVLAAACVLLATLRHPALSR